MASKSLSVNELVNKFSSEEGLSPRGQEDAQKTRSRSKFKVNPSTRSSTQNIKEEGSENRKKKEINESGLLSILGPEVRSFPLSEETYLEIVRLKIEQEKTKQQEYKLELVNRNLSIVQSAVQGQVPGYLIPYLCVGNLSEAPGQKNDSQVTEMTTQKKDRGDFFQDQSPVISSEFPLHYKYEGPLTPTANKSQSQQKSAGGNIDAGTSPNTYSQSRLISTPSSSRRHTSSRPEYGFTGLNTISPDIVKQESQTGYCKPRLSSGALDLSPYFYGPSDPHKAPQSPSNEVAPKIQVKPSPAQPLHKQTRLSKQPSQESMTSAQHVIQFHHWKPGLAPPNQNLEYGSSSRSHKRHKSTLENMSIDLGSSPGHFNKQSQPHSSTIRGSGNSDHAKDEDLDEQDMTMDTTLTGYDDTQGRK